MSHKWSVVASALREVQATEAERINRERPTWDEILGDVPPWVRRCHLSDRRPSIEMLRVGRCKLELMEILAEMMKNHDAEKSV